ncbi:hypothetical protein LM500401_100300 [Listeria monocytogenes]|nr:hypothetical protein LM500401_100300 [Listeria monocytogenes]
MIWCCVASPQSNSQIVFRSFNIESAMDVTLRPRDGTPAPVPKKTSSISVPFPSQFVSYFITFLNEQEINIFMLKTLIIQK